MEIVFVPNWSRDNPLQNLLKAQLELTDTVVFDDFSAGLRPFTGLATRHPSMDILHLHWITEIVQLVTWHRSHFKFYLKLIIVLADLRLLRSRNVKVIWTVHNRYAHQGLKRIRERLIRRWLAKSVDGVIVHFKGAANSLVTFYGKRLPSIAAIIPHGNYIERYPSPPMTKSKVRRSWGIKSSDTVIFFFGAVRPYKGLEVLLNAFQSQECNDTLSLVIAGHTSDSDYSASVLRYAEQLQNVRVELGFLEDQKLVDYINACDAVVIPFGDTLTSGSVIFAMSQCRALVLPERAKILGCVPERGACYFENEDELACILSSVHENDFEIMGIRNYQAAKQLTWKSSADQHRAVYLRD